MADDPFISNPDGTVVAPARKTRTAAERASRIRGRKATFGAKGGSGLGTALKLGGTAMGALNGVGGAAFGIMGLLQLLEMLGDGGGGQSDRQSDALASQQFLEDPMVEEEGQQMAMRQGLNSRLNVTGPKMVGGGYDDGEAAFLDEMEARHGARMQEHMRRTPATMAEIAAVAGLM